MREVIKMAASRKMYREIAESIRMNLAGLTPKQTEGAAIIVRAIANDFKCDNRVFRYDTFFTAAGLDEFGYPIKAKRVR